MKVLSIVFILSLSIFLMQACEPESTVLTPDNKPFIPNIPEGFSSSDFFKNIPADNPLTEKGVELGRMLFYDKILSSDGTISCASCHNIANSFADDRAFSLGVNGAPGIINSMPLINMGFSKSFFWDGRANTLEQQAIIPITSSIEMHETAENVVLKLQNHANYPKRFFNAFGSEKVTIENIAKAVAQFERTLISGNSQWDVFLNAAKKTNLDEAYFIAGFTPDQIQGYRLFSTEKAECFHCHETHLGTTNAFDDNGLVEFTDGTGLGAITGKAEDDGKFKIPTLRNIQLTAPYMHDGRFKTLDEVLNFYMLEMKPSKNLNSFLKDDQQLNGGVLISSSQEEFNAQKKQILEFLKVFSDTTFVNNPAFKNPF